MHKKDRGDFISALITYFRNNSKYSKNEVDKIEYAWESIKGDIQKICLLYIFAIPFHLSAYLTSVLISMICIRMLIGGIHMKTYWSCLFMTATWIVFGGVIGWVCIRNNEYLLFVLSIITMVSICFLGIAISSKRKKICEKERLKRKHIAITMEIFITIFVFLILRDSIWGRGLLVGLIISNLQVIIIKVKEKMI